MLPVRYIYLAQLSITITTYNCTTDLKDFHFEYKLIKVSAK